MGQAVTKLFSVARREVNMFNLEKRTEKVISKDKPSPAPLHESTKRELERMNEDNVSKEYLHNKDEQLDEYLKKVFVTSPDPTPPTKVINNPERPLPQERRSNIGNVSYGYCESEEVKVPEGRVSLKQALQLISDHEEDPEKHSNTAIAEKYKLPITTTDDILEHFRMFNLPLKQPEVDIDKLSTYEKLQLRIKTMTAITANKIGTEINEIVKNKEMAKEKNDLKSNEENIDTSLEIDTNKDRTRPYKKDSGENR